MLELHLEGSLLGELEFVILIDDDRWAWSRAGERWLWPWSWAPEA